MSIASTPPSGRTAWSDPATRRAVGGYALRTTGLVSSALVLAFLGSLTLDDNGNTRSGVPELVTFALIGMALMGAILGVSGLFNLFRIMATVVRRPWIPVTAEFERLEMGATNGQPTIRVAIGDRKELLTISAVVWRWKQFDTPDLLFATGSGRRGVVATPDRRSVVWAGWSPASAYLQRRRRE